MSEQSYRGSCHCGAVSFQVTAEINEVMSCNCSICARRGHLLSFVPLEKFNLLSGDDALTDYQFGNKHIHHLFCKTCGVNSFGAGAMPDGSEIRAINVRCLEGFDFESLPVNKVDGKSL